MAPVNNLLLDTLSFCLLTRCQQYYIPAGKIFELLYMTGVRREEATDFSLWEVVDASNIKLNALKGNNPRFFSEDEVPQWFFDSVQDGTAIYPDFTKFKVNYYVKLLQLQVMYTDEKMLLSNMYRHNYAKKLYYSGMSYEDIRVKMGENTLSVVQGYINNPIYSTSFLFLEIPFTSTQAQFFTTSANNYIKANNPCLFALNYADNSNPLFVELPTNTNYNFPDHTFSSPFGSTISKTVTLYLQAPNTITELAFNTTYFEGTVSANFNQLISLNTLYLRFTKFTNISNLFINSTALVNISLSFPLDNLNPSTVYSFSPNLFTGQILTFYLIGNVFSTNYPFDNLSYLFLLSSPTQLIFDRYYFSTAPQNFSNFSNLSFLQFDITTFTSNEIPNTLANNTSIQTLVVNSASLESYNTIKTLTNLRSFLQNNNTNFPTSIDSEMSNLTLLKTLLFRNVFATQLRFDAFINSFYTFIDTNASKTSGNTQFRQMTIEVDGNSLLPSGTYQMPSGYIQGSNNGTPASEYEKVWVLVNQYAHNWPF